MLGGPIRYSITGLLSCLIASASSVSELAEELGISTSSLRRWINEYDEYDESAFPGHGNALFNVRPAWAQSI